MGFLRRLFAGPTLHTEVELTHESCKHPCLNQKDLCRKTCPEMHVYKIRGRSSETDRLQTIRRVALGSSNQDAIIASCDLYDIQSFEIIEQELPTEAQINYAINLGIILSDKYTKDDLSCLITRATNETDRDDMIPVDVSLAELAADHNIYLSEFSGEKRALDHLWWQFTEDEKIRFLIFSIHQNHLKKQDYDLNHSPYISLYNQFVEEYRNNQQLQRSLSRYIGSDLSLHKEPNKQRNAYKIVSEYLTK